MSHGKLGTGNPASVRIYASLTVVAAAILLAVVIFDFQLAAAQSFPSFVLDPFRLVEIF
ncbi:hypothetical protein [Bradyrhizobium sp. NBAIM08]|uniref:hypothetical protein n=1 Tax=Bradyrhizobium sp. NBAIM08 TaxID=2793815 RepID=UPI001CD761B2|nr:hypothetical protein [Bradyrhizobium sp. NBAIM08]MCA1475586.1 hypothetical protein [Bradyrhizobium sp. NBAIM08]